MTGRLWNHTAFRSGFGLSGIGPLHAHLFTSGLSLFYSATDQEALKAAFLLARLEGIIPALESAHALANMEKISFGKEEKYRDLFKRKRR
jgi:tryptophan synthase beta chain